MEEEPELRYEQARSLLADLMSRSLWEGSELVDGGTGTQHRRVLLGHYYHAGRGGAVFLQPLKVTFYLTDDGEVTEERNPASSWPFTISIKRCLAMLPFMTYRSGGLVYHETEIKTLCLASRVVYENRRLDSFGDLEAPYEAPYFGYPSKAEQLLGLGLVLAMIGLVTLLVTFTMIAAIPTPTRLFL